MLALLAVLAMLPSLLCGYIYDDVMLIEDNSYVKHLEYVGRAFATHFWDVPAFGSGGIGLIYYRPLVTLSYLFNWLLGGGAPWVFHLFNVLTHAACTYLVMQIGWRWLGSRVLAATAALVFAVHGSRAESVIWIAGRTDVLMALWLLLGVQAAAFGARAVETRSTRGSLLRVAGALCLLLALSCKEAALMAPLLLGMEWLATSDSEARQNLARQTAVWTLLCALYVAIRAWLLPLAPEKTELSLLHGFTTLGLYLERIVWPWPQTFFFRPVAEVAGHVVFSKPHLVVGALLVAGFIAAAYRALRGARQTGLRLTEAKPVHAVALLLLAAAFMGPLLNFTTTGIFVSSSDHFLYLPLWLLTLGTLGLFRRGCESWLQTRGSQLLLAAFSLVSIGMLWARSFECQSNATLWPRELEINADNPFVLREVAKELAGEGHLDEAQALFAQSLEPASAQYVMLAPPGSNLEVHHRVVSIEAALRADGDVVALGALMDELRNLAQGELGAQTTTVGRAQLGRRFSAEELAKALGKDRMRPEWRAEAAMVAARLCLDAEANAFLAAVPDRYLSSVVSPENLVLTELRIGNFERARDRLLRLGNKADTPEEILPNALVQQLTARATRAQAALHAAAQAPAPGNRMLRAMAQTELGSYLCALRELRPLYDQVGPERAPQYVQLLLAAGLQQEAFRELLRALPQDQARQQLAALEAGLSKRILEQTRVSEPSPWWTAAPTP